MGIEDIERLRPRLAQNQPARISSGPRILRPQSVARARRSLVVRLPAAAAAATATAVAAATRASTARAGLVLRLVHAQGPAAHLVAVEVLDGARCIRLTHLDEAEAARAAGFAVSGQRHRFDGAVLGEQCAYIRLGGGEGEVSDVYLGHAMTLWKNQSIQMVSAGQSSGPAIHSRNVTRSRERSSRRPSNRKSCYLIASVRLGLEGL